MFSPCVHKTPENYSIVSFCMHKQDHWELQHFEPLHFLGVCACMVLQICAPKAPNAVPSRDFGTYRGSRCLDFQGFCLSESLSAPPSWIKAAILDKFWCRCGRPFLSLSPVYFTGHIPGQDEYRICIKNPYIAYPVRL